MEEKVLTLQVGQKTLALHTPNVSDKPIGSTGLPLQLTLGHNPKT
jgi:hypothetical protein